MTWKSNTNKSLPLLAFLLVVICKGYSQIDNEVDSLRNRLAGADDTTQVSILIHIGDAFSKVSKNDSALANYFLALHAAETSAKPIYEMKALRAVAYLYSLGSNTEMAVKFAFRAMNIARKLNSVKDEFAVQFLIGNIYLSVHPDSARKYLLRNLASITTNTDKKTIVSTYSSLGDLYRNLGKFDSAQYFASKALTAAKSLNDKRFVAMCLNNSATIYTMQGKHDLAISDLKQAYEILGASGSTFEQAFAAFNISVAYSNMGQLDKAIAYAFDALDKVQSTENEDRAVLHQLTLKYLSDMYARKKDYQKALEYMALYNHLKDSLNTTESQNRVLQLESQYQVEKNEKEIEGLKNTERLNARVQNALIAGTVLLVIIVVLIARQYQLKRRSEAIIHAKNNDLTRTLVELKAAQSQLIQSEKMASLGEITAGIAHEIQNPLNFVNNFSEVSKELLDEMKEGLEKGNTEDAKELARNVIENLEKINLHGKRADGIVKSMLQHSRKSSGQKELTDINALCDEYLRLAYHGLRAKDKSFNAKFETHLDPTLTKINVVPQEIGRVVLNLVNNAFYAVGEKAKLGITGYEPTVLVRTSSPLPRRGAGGEARVVEITVSDNGSGIPDHIKDKIFQPFFTTKPTGQGTGLGLSLSYDIVTKGHQGELKVVTKENEGSEFIVTLPSS